MKVIFLTICLLWASLTLVSSIPVPEDNGPLMIRYDLSGVDWSKIDWSKIDWNKVFGNNNQQPPPKNNPPKNDPPKNNPPKNNPPKDNPPKNPPKDDPPPSSGTNNPPSGSSGKALWGLDYSPYNTDGSCPDAATVAGQLKKVAELTTRIRLYSTDCSQLYSVLEAIKDEKLDLDVYPGIWVRNGQTRVNTDMDAFFKAVKDFGSDRVKGLSVGNEELSNGISEDQLIGYMSQVRSQMKDAKLDKIPLYFTEQNGKFTKSLAAHSDLVQVNIYSVFNGQYTNMADSVKSTFDQLKQIKDNVAGGKEVRIGETGWSSNGNTGACPLTLQDQTEYAQQFVCQANKENVEYFYFEAKDAMWKKDANLPEIERHFGVFTENWAPKFDFSIWNKC